MKQTEVVNHWIDVAKKMLLHKKIVGVRYLLDEEMEMLGWDDRCVVLILDDGNMIFPSCDDEGNRAGALFTNNSDQPVLPVI